MASRKGTEQAMWIVIALVIALVVAVVLITVFSKTVGNVEEQTDPTIAGGGSALWTTTCRLICDSCRLSSDPDSCWNNKGSDCEGFSCIYSS